MALYDVSDATKYYLDIQNNFEKVWVKSILFKHVDIDL